uniref:Uncharacterized protein n=1 Tax=Populus alba TaxID=43335 RepID=A0A4U5MW47_POPAL|nr:hypothetical protein D5086_0000299410 [Populus alba]
MEVAARNSIVPASHAMQVARRGGSQTVTSFGSRKFCTHCEQGGHLVDQCYYLIGFPIGHKWHGKNMKPRNKKTTINNIEMKRESTDESPTFTAEEYKQIMALLKNGNNQPFANATETLDDNPVLPIPSSLATLPETTTHPQPTLSNQPSTQPNLAPPSPSHNTYPPTVATPHPTPLKVYSRRPHTTTIVPLEPPVTTSQSSVPSTFIDPSVSSLTNVTEPPIIDPIQTLPEPRHSTRLHRPPPYLQDFQTYHAVVLGPDVSSASMSGTRYPLHRYVSYSGLSSPYRSFEISKEEAILHSPSPPESKAFFYKIVS